WPAHWFTSRIWWFAMSPPQRWTENESDPLRRTRYWGRPTLGSLEATSGYPPCRGSVGGRNRQDRGGQSGPVSSLCPDGHGRASGHSTSRPHVGTGQLLFGWPGDQFAVVQRGPHSLQHRRANLASAWDGDQLQIGHPPRPRRGRERID